MSNKTEDPKIIMYDSPEAAQQVTVTGWQSSDGRFYGKDEHTARWAGCTHTTCQCGNPVVKTWIRCETCRQKTAYDNYNKLEFKEWDEQEYVCTSDGDKYFFNKEDLLEHMYDNKLEEIDLLICKPMRYHHVDAEIVVNSETHEDWEPDDELEKKISEFNKYLDTLSPHSWYPGKIRTSYRLTEDEIKEMNED